MIEPMHHRSPWAEEQKAIGQATAVLKRACEFDPSEMKWRENGQDFGSLETGTNLQNLSRVCPLREGWEAPFVDLA